MRCYECSWEYLSSFVDDRFIAEDIICIPSCELSDSLCQRLYEDHDIDAGDYEYFIAERDDNVVLDRRTADNLMGFLEDIKMHLPEALCNCADIYKGWLRCQ